MSHRMTKWVVASLLAGILLAGISCYIGDFHGEHRGRAEMKHWQDDWYTQHPVVKEVKVNPLIHMGPVDSHFDCTVLSMESLKCDQIPTKLKNKPQSTPRIWSEGRKAEYKSGYKDGYYFAQHNYGEKPLFIQESDYKHVVKGWYLKGTCPVEGETGLWAYNMVEPADGPCVLVKPFSEEKEDADK